MDGVPWWQKGRKGVVIVEYKPPNPHGHWGAAQARSHAHSLGQMRLWARICLVLARRPPSFILGGVWCAIGDIIVY